MAAGSPPWPATISLVLLALSSIILPALSVDRGKFKRCDQSGFCKRNRDYAETVSSHGTAWTSPYDLDPTSISFNDATLSGIVFKTVNATSKETVRLPLTVAFLESGAARVTIDEERRQKEDIELRHDSKARKGRYNEAEKWAVVNGLNPGKGASLSEAQAEGTTRVSFGETRRHEAVIRHSPLAIAFYRDGEKQIGLNERGLMNYEHWRAKIEKQKKEGDENSNENTTQNADATSEDEGEDESTWWEETFGGHTDSKPRGPESVALDINFPGYGYVYGIPEHSGPMSLRQTKGGREPNFDEPYRMYNSDVFEYEIDSPMTLYGSIPFMQAQKPSSTVGVFWLNAAETWVDITKISQSTNPLYMSKASGATDTQTHWISEAGILDLFILLGPTPEDVSKTYSELTGTTQLPQLFAIAYHQCRWNYVTDQDVRTVDRKFDRHHIPYDVIWLDIDYLDDKKFFTWDPLTFSDPVGMQDQLDDHHRKLVGIIDPHVKKLDGYFVHDELISKDLAIKTKEATGPWDGQCWPGTSNWVDCFNPAARDWWKTLFRYDRFAGSRPNTFIWNDMGEPSIFNGVEMTMPKDSIHHEGWEHRDLHNANGMTFHNATFHALLVRDDPKAQTPSRRPFILTRSFYAGSQRLGAAWIGDNQALFSHLRASIPMVLNQGISGFPFTGADVGGFMGNPSQELQVRWYQAGAFYPFFRAHSHLDTRRREPYLAEKGYEELIAQAIRLRYSLLPAWYTAFHAASTHGYPIVRPMWWVHPADPTAFDDETQFYLGATGLLVRPVTDEGATSAAVHLTPGTALYYDYSDHTVYRSDPSSSKTVTVSAPLGKIPILMRAGHIFPRRDRPRRSAGLMQHDPFTLVVVLDPADQASSAEGSLYLDDGATFAYTTGARIHRRFTFSGGALSSSDADTAAVPPSVPAKEWVKNKEAYLRQTDGLFVEKIVVVGAPKEWRNKGRVRVESEDGKAKGEAEMLWLQGGKGKADWAVVKKPGVGVGRGWRISF